TEDSQTIPRIFTLETQLASKASLIEQPFKPQLTSASHEAMQDIDWKAVPPLGGYVATTLKQAAELVLMSHQEDPVLATWRYGLGRSAAFTSDAKAKWGVLWLRWRDFNKFWAQLTRWTLRSGTRSDTTAVVARHDRTGEVIVDAVDSKGELIGDAQLTGGGTLGEPRETFQRGRRQSRIAIDVWPWLVGLVAVMMVPEIALRRLGAGAWQRIIPARWRRDPERGQNDA